MSFLHLPAARSPAHRSRVLAVPALVLAAGIAWAGPPSKLSEGAWFGPPMRAGHGYNEPKPPAPPPAKVTRAPVRYTITIAVSPPKGDHAAVPLDNPNQALILAHLPEGASLWLEGDPTVQRGKLRHFSSPPLKRGKKYHYTARVVWFEDGQWFSQTLKVPVWAGRSSCLFLPRPSAVTAALDELSRADRRLATEQKFCAVQPENLLGAMGKPVKAALKGQPVFLCCAECVKEARRNPDQALARVRELRARKTLAPAK